MSTKEVFIKNIAIGNGNSVAVQSMINTKTQDIQATIAQINALKNAGCDIVRFTVPDAAAAGAVRAIVDGTDVPLVADIHFDYSLAIKSMENGIHKIRINPGNIGAGMSGGINDNRAVLKKIVDCAKMHNVPIRIGVNSGSIEQDIFKKCGNTSGALYESAVRNVKALEYFGFNNIVISAKASDAKKTVETYRLLSALPYPLHIGVTEAGTYDMSVAKSYSALGSLLLDGIGNTIRISITGTRYAK